jgi:NAD(P)H-hydrate epimerase
MWTKGQAGDVMQDTNKGYLIPLVTNVPAVTTEQMVEVDRVMIQEYGITLVRMMENAGRNLADLVRFKLGPPEGKTIVVLAGGGNNGGGGMVAARHLTNWGANVVVVPTARGEGSGVASEQLTILQKMNVPITNSLGTVEIARADLFIDALIGYGLKGAPRGETAEWIRLANASHKPIIALDTPSGLDTGSGEIFDPCIHADATLTLALPKTGLYAASASNVVGELYLADISVPRAIFKRMGLEVSNIFASASLVQVR